MKKVISMLAVAALLCVGLAFTSCSACPGGGNTSKKGECTVDVSGAGDPKGYIDCEDLCTYGQYYKESLKSSYKGGSYSCDC